MKKYFFMSGVMVMFFSAQVKADSDDSPWTIDVDSTVVNDSNISRADKQRDIVSDKSGVLNIGVAWTKMIDTKLALTLRGFAEAEHFKVIDKLDRETVGIQALVRWQNYIGYTAPVYQISLSSQNDHYKVHQRDSDVFTLQASVAKRLTDSITLNYGVEGMLRNSDGSVFDLQ